MAHDRSVTRRSLGVVAAAIFIPVLSAFALSTTPGVTPPVEPSRFEEVLADSFTCGTFGCGGGSSRCADLEWPWPGGTTVVTTCYGTIRPT